MKKMGNWSFHTIGLIHSANVRTVNLEKACVSVEWTEGGATKGKEVSFMSVPPPHVTPSYLKDLCENGTCESLVFDAVLSFLILNMVLFGCIGILLNQACSKLKQSIVSGVFVKANCKES